MDIISHEYVSGVALQMECRDSDTPAATAELLKRLGKLDNEEHFILSCYTLDASVAHDYSYVLALEIESWHTALLRGIDRYSVVHYFLEICFCSAILI